jgi:hypothetical protein
VRWELVVAAIRKNKVTATVRELRLVLGSYGETAVGAPILNQDQAIRRAVTLDVLNPIESVSSDDHIRDAQSLDSSDRADKDGVGLFDRLYR